MTREEVVKLAREVGLSITRPRSGQYDGGRVGGDVVGLMKFAALVSSHERDACEAIASELWSPKRGAYGNGFNQCSIDIEEKIIARGCL